MEAEDIIRAFKLHIAKFRFEVCDRAKDVDPGDERDWYCMSVGYFLAMGCSIDEAYVIANHVRYDCEYWQ